MVFDKNKKVLADGDETFSDGNIDEHENDEDHHVTFTSGMEELHINEHPLEINRWFNELPVRILNSHDMPFFYAEDISKILGIRNVRKSVENFDQSEIVSQELRKKCNIITYKKYKKGFRKDNKMILLTEFGVYRMLLGSRSEKSTEFKHFIYDVLYKLRTVGEYKINQKLQELNITNEQLLEKNKTLEKSLTVLKEKQEKFKNLCEKLYLIEFSHDPYLIKQPIPKFLMSKRQRAKQFMIEKSPAFAEIARAKPNENAINDPYAYGLIIAREKGIDKPGFIDVDNDAPMSDIRAAHEHNVAIAHKLIRENVPTSSYLITANPAPEQLTAGKCVHSVWVKSARDSLKKLGVGGRRLYNENKENLIKLLDAIEE